MRKPHVTYFLFPTILALLIGGFFLSSYSKEEIHLFINANHQPLADVFFKYWTHLGEGWLFLLAIPVALLASWRSALQVALAGLFTLVITSLFKKWLYAGEPRPIEYFTESAQLNLVEGVTMAHWNSFPSGHTTAAFAIWFALALVVKNKYLSIVFFTTALLVGYSRMYLNQHFLVDVVAGIGFGVACAAFAFWVGQRAKGTFWETRVLN